MTFSVPAELIQRYGVNGPRYTSYPTAVDFSTDFSYVDVQKKLERAETSDRPLSLYFHIPFCRSLCWYCGCHTLIGRDESRAQGYVDRLIQEIKLRSAGVKDRKAVQVHYGGGTPTYLTPAQLETLGNAIREHFNVADDAECAIEIDPRRLSEDHIRALANTGFRRASIGIQDVDQKVQANVNRLQSMALVEQSIAWLRAQGFDSINFDLIYGLPGQTVDTFSKTLDAVLALGPDRFAIYAYAHVPWMRPAQKLLESKGLPDQPERVRMHKMIVERLVAQGYVHIGLDHFARKDNELSRALEDGSLQRNFQGYSTCKGTDILGFGISAISQFPDVYVQNFRELEDYEGALDEGKWPLERIIELDEDDQIRREMIMNVMCHHEISYDALRKQVGVDVADYFRTEIEKLKPLAEDQLVDLKADGFRITPTGKVFLRNIAMVFDNKRRDPGRHSTTV